MSPLLDEVRRSEYTGENRCWPCTITNVVLLSIAVGVLFGRGRRKTATALATAGIAGIGLRGYLVPYTPRFAPSLVAALPVDPFDHHDAEERAGSLADSSVPDDSDGVSAHPDGEAILTALFEAGVVVPEGEEIQLEPSFASAWSREMETLRNLDVEELAAIADERSDPAVDAHTRRSWGRPVIVLEPESGPSVTLRRGVAIAELAAARALEFESAVDDAAIRRAAGRPLRSLLEECPRCGGEVTITRSSCCGETTPIGQTPSEKLVCRACNVRYFTYDE
ncbi:hypothetical protein ACLI4Y_06430 [Natrialbaceae archaeon A-CW3]